MRTRLAAAAGLWALCVGAVALLAWLAIDTAGRQVPAQALAADGAGPVAGPDRSGPAVTAPGPADGPGGRGVPRPGGDDPAVFSVDAGRVSARCVGSAISLDGGYARPETGWAVEVLAGGPGQVRVVFSDSRRAVEVVGRCVDGRPRYDRRSVDLSPSSSPAAPPAGSGGSDDRWDGDHDGWNGGGWNGGGWDHDGDGDHGWPGYGGPGGSPDGPDPEAPGGGQSTPAPSGTPTPAPSATPSPVPSSPQPLAGPSGSPVAPEPSASAGS